MIDDLDTAVANSSFSTLLAAIRAANLIDIPKEIGPFVISALTDAEFAKFPPEIVESFLNNIHQLNKVLTYHVVSGKVMPVVKVESSNGKISTSQSIDEINTPQSEPQMVLLITVSSTSLLVPKTPI